MTRTISTTYAVRIVDTNILDINHGLSLARSAILLWASLAIVIEIHLFYNYWYVWFQQEYQMKLEQVTEKYVC